MLQVMVVARVIAALFGTTLDANWACWENVVAQPRYVCEWFQVDDDKAGMYAGVWSDGETYLDWTVEYMPGSIPLVGYQEVVLAPDAQTAVQVEMGDANVYYQLNGGWWEVMGPYYYGQQPDAFLLVLLPAGTGTVPFSSDGSFWLSTYQVPAPPDPA